MTTQTRHRLLVGILAVVSAGFLTLGVTGCVGETAEQAQARKDCLTIFDTYDQANTDTYKYGVDAESSTGAEYLANLAPVRQKMDTVAAKITSPTIVATATRFRDLFDKAAEAQAWFIDHPKPEEANGEEGDRKGSQLSRAQSRMIIELHELNKICHPD